MDSIYLLKLGEIHLKGDNQQEFINLLRKNLKSSMAGIQHRLEARQGRFYLHCAADHHAAVAARLDSLCGINAWALCRAAPKEPQAIRELVLACYREQHEKGLRRFKIESRRADKGFALDSYQLSREMGHAVCEAFPDAVVEVHAPETTIFIEVRERAYVYSDSERGVRGLPVGCAGKGLLLLSGGIDSPVAGFHMLRRGLGLELLYCHAYPYTSNEAWEKVRSLAAVLARFNGPATLHTVSCTELQVAMKKHAPETCTTLYFRAAMMKIADTVAKARGLNSIITGESLSQVASQTAENLRFSQSYTDLPVLRPLCGTDKEDIIRTARSIGTYDISILPYADCCVLFSPKHPILKANFERERRAYAQLQTEALIQEALATIETITVEPQYGSR